MLNTIATYLHTPGKFARGVDKEDRPCFIAPETLEEPHCLVPVRIGSEEGTMLTKIYLSKEYCADPGAIFSAVLVTPTKEEIFLFYHKTTGTVAG